MKQVSNVFLRKSDKITEEYDQRPKNLEEREELAKLEAYGDV